jgi:hypothetical protein
MSTEHLDEKIRSWPEYYIAGACDADFCKTDGFYSEARRMMTIEEAQALYAELQRQKSGTHAK